MTIPVLEARGLSRRFGHVQALDDCDFDVFPGEVVALIGDNGAGKSTLIKAMTGNLDLDEGTVLVDGKPVHFASPQDASAAGIEVVHQDLALAPHLDPAQNMYLGRELVKGGLLGALGFLDKATMHAEAMKSFRRLGSAVTSVRTPVGAMSGGQKQSVAIARSVAWASRVLILDEPTAALGVVQTKNVLEMIRRVCSEGIAVVFISHTMPHVLQVADRIQVLRLGHRVATYDAKDVTTDLLVSAMTGSLELSQNRAPSDQPKTQE